MAELTGIESKLFTTHDFRLENGQTLPVVELPQASQQSHWKAARFFLPSKLPTKPTAH